MLWCAGHEKESNGGELSGEERRGEESGEGRWSIYEQVWGRKGDQTKAFAWFHSQEFFFFLLFSSLSFSLSLAPLLVLLALLPLHQMDTLLHNFLFSLALCRGLNISIWLWRSMLKWQEMRAFPFAEALAEH